MRNLLLLAAVAFLCVPRPVYPAENVMTLAECIQAAKSNNYRIQELLLDKQSKELRLKAAWNNIIPQLSFNMGYGAGRSYLYSTEAETLSSGYNANVSVSQALFRSGYHWANIKKAQNNLAISVLSYTQQENTLVQSIKSKYFRALQNKNLVRMRADDVKRKEDNLALIQLLYNVGSEKKANLDQASLDLETAQFDLLDAREALKISLQRLAVEMGYELSAAVDISGELRYAPYSFNQAEALRKALKARPDYLQKELSLKSAGLDKVTARSEFLPSVNVSAGYDWNSDAFFPARRGWNVGFNVSLPLLSGFPLYTNLKDAQTNIDSLTISRQQLEKSIAIDVLEAASSLTLADKNVKIREKAVSVAREREILGRMEYSQGKISYFEFSDAGSRLSTAEISYIESIYNYENAKANLEFVTGGAGVLEEKK